MTYPRHYVARNNRLELNTGSAIDTVEMTVDGFTGSSAPTIYAYDVTDRANPVRLTVDPTQVAPTAAGWSVKIQTVAAAGHGGRSSPPRQRPPAPRSRATQLLTLSHALHRLTS